MKLKNIIFCLFILTLASCSSEKSSTSTTTGFLTFTNLNPDGTDSVGANVNNIWFFSSDGSQATPLTTITDTNTNAVYMNLSPDGTMVVFQSNQALDGSDASNTNNTFNIWTVNTDGTNLTPLTNLTTSDSDAGYPQWSPDGSKIAYLSFAATDGSGNANGTGNIWVMDADGQNQTPLTSLTTAGIVHNFLRWSADGTKIFFNTTRALDGSDANTPLSTFNIWSVDVDGSNETPLTQNDSGGAYSILYSVSADGNHIAYFSKAALDGSDAPNLNQTYNIWIMDTDGTNQTPLTSLTDTAADCFSPVFSPDSQHIAYTSDRALDGTDTGSSPRNYNLWLMDIDGTNNVAVTNLTTVTEDHGVSSVDFLDDGSLLFVSSGALDGTDAENTNGANNIWSADADGQNPAPLTSYEGADISITFY